MGKLLNYILMLVFIDLLLMITGQIDNTVNSVLLSTILDVHNFTFGLLWQQLISSVTENGLAWIIGAVAGVATGYFISVTDTKLFIPAGLVLGTLVTDFYTFYDTMINSGVDIVLATLIITPIIVSFTFMIIEWVRGRD